MGQCFYSVPRASAQNLQKREYSSTINSMQGMEPQGITQLLHVRVDQVGGESNGQYMDETDTPVLTVSLQTLASSVCSPSLCLPTHPGLGFPNRLLFLLFVSFFQVQAHG